MPNITKPYPSWIASYLPPYIQSRFFSSSLGKIHYLQGGSGKTVVMVHGNPTWSFLWRKVMSELDQEKWQIYAPDLFNLGFSDSLTSGLFSMDSQSKGLVEWIEKLDLKEITLVVQDWGGPIGLYAASQLAERIQSLVILNTGIGPPRAPFKLSRFHSFANMPILADIVFPIFGVPMYHLGRVQGDPASISGDVAKAYRFPIRKFRRWDSALKFARMVPVKERDPSIPLMQKVEDFVSNFEGPIEVVWGMKDPILGRGLKRIRKKIPQASITETSAGHFLQEECPKEIADAIVRTQSVSM